jgi:hypothetical protein
MHSGYGAANAKCPSHRERLCKEEPSFRASPPYSPHQKLSRRVLTQVSNIHFRPLARTFVIGKHLTRSVFFQSAVSSEELD